MVMVDKFPVGSKVRVSNRGTPHISPDVMNRVGTVIGVAPKAALALCVRFPYSHGPDRHFYIGEEYLELASERAINHRVTLQEGHILEGRIIIPLEATWQEGDTVHFAIRVERKERPDDGGLDIRSET